MKFINKVIVFTGSAGEILNTLKDIKEIYKSFNSFDHMRGVILG